jgi:hypothetical protein
MDDPFAILQSERSQFDTRGPVIDVENASHPQTICDLDEHRGDIHYLTGWCLGDVHCEIRTHSHSKDANVSGVLSREHSHTFVELPPHLAVSDVVRRVKGRSSRRVKMEFPDLRK